MQLPKKFVYRAPLFRQTRRSQVTENFGMTTKDGAEQTGEAADVAEAYRLLAEPWFIDKIDFVDGSLTIQGWAFIDVERVDGDYAERFSFNGRAFDRVDYPLLRTDVGDAFPSRRGAERSGFVLRAANLSTPYRDGVLQIACDDRDATGPAAGRNDWFVPDPALHPDLPDEDRRFRVIGNRDPTSFLMSGCTDFNRLDRACVYAKGKRIADHANVLDWGVGCGRLARHFGPRANDLAGCDIDADNVHWCQQNLPGRYFVSSLRPPLPYGDARFDLIYGLSIFTHFRPAIEALWLAELERVAAPGALLLMTTHGRTTVDYAHIGPPAARALLELIESQGIVFGGSNDQLDGHVEHNGEYVNVYHSHDYIRRTWGRHFDILDILPGYIFTHDLIVMRKRV